MRADTLRKQNATLTRRCNALKSHVTRVALDNSRLRESNAVLCHALRQAQIPVPAGAQMVAQSVGEGHQDQLVPMLTGIAPPPTDLAVIPAGEIPYCMRMCHLPDTSTIATSTRFKAKPVRWPHAVATYLRTNDSLTSIVEKRGKQLIEFQLFDRRNAARTPTERNLKPNDGPMPNLLFELHLLYDDNDAPVTIESLNQTRIKAITTVSDPDILASATMPMRNGRVTFRLTEINVLSAMTEPRHRRFRYRLVCVDDVLGLSPQLQCDSPAFYCMAKIKKMAVA